MSMLDPNPPNVRVDRARRLGSRGFPFLLCKFLAMICGLALIEFALGNRDDFTR
jgi:hypothetical protein